MTHHHDDCETVRMIRYKIAFIKEDYEAVLHEEQVVVPSEELDCGASFEVQKTAEFFQRKRLRIPDAWVSSWGDEGNPDQIVYPPPSYRIGSRHYHGIPEEDKKYLRFFQEEEASYQRRRDTQVRVLREIQKDGLKIQAPVFASPADQAVVDLESMTIDELKDYADSKAIDLTGAARKSEILEKIRDKS